MASYPPKAPETGATFISRTHNTTYPAISPATHSTLANRAVFITGASRGIGLAIARSCVAAGCTRLALAANDTSASSATLTAAIAPCAPPATRAALRVLFFALDVRDARAVEAAAAATARAFGGLDVLVNNAGYMPPWAPISGADSDPDAWWSALEINLRGTHLATRAFVPLLLARGESGLKTIVNVSSTGALALRAGASAYQVSKMAVLKFTESVVTEYAGRGLLCYAVHPGSVRTELGLSIPESMYNVLTDTPELAGDTVVFLAHERREWLAGRLINCNWDMPEFLQKEKEIVEGDKLKVRLVV
ncbi:oxidoreductase-like protein [Macrophomina phaseolina]|uniref:Oxidoreductase-like protein n=1 Tax=Macrophomina phaseolina TaxID=35725 RepID=A0ABQ8G4G2_9PEZI|nr:oxidoreductase-like protein [Macrophomina phaseolina]